MKEKSSLKSIIGFSDIDTVKLDFDDTPFSKVKYWALRTMRWFRLEGFVILKSSEKSYHVVFNRAVAWTLNLHIVAWASLLSHNKGLTKYLQMQCIKESSTLRISPKREKPSPRVVFRFGAQDKQIEGFLKLRRRVKRMIGQL